MLQPFTPPPTPQQVPAPATIVPLGAVISGFVAYDLFVGNQMDASSGAAISTSLHFHPLFFGEDGNTEGFGLGRFRAGVGADHHIVGLLGDRASDLGAQRFCPRFRFRALRHRRRSGLRACWVLMRLACRRCRSV